MEQNLCSTENHCGLLTLMQNRKLRKHRKRTNLFQFKVPLSYWRDSKCRLGGHFHYMSKCCQFRVAGFCLNKTSETFFCSQRNIYNHRRQCIFEVNIDSRGSQQCSQLVCCKKLWTKIFSTIKKMENVGNSRVLASKQIKYFTAQLPIFWLKRNYCRWNDGEIHVYWNKFRQKWSFAPEIPSYIDNSGKIY